MSLTAGIVGLPNVGKSTLFNAITKKNILIANYPFATIEPNQGVVIVPDERIDFLNNLYVPKSLIPTTFEFTDIAGLVKGASKGEGLGNKFLSHIREVDAIIEVVRCFKDDNVIHVNGEINPVDDIEVINAELIISDLEIAINRLIKIEKKAYTSKDKQSIKEVELLKRIKESLEASIPLRKLEFDEDEMLIIKNFNFITLKPFIYALNIGEGDLNNSNKYVDDVIDYALKENSEFIILCAKIESELSEMSNEDKLMFMNELGIKESGLDQLIKKTYDILGLATYFTVGSDEVRAWTFRKGMKAPECAGIIHSDFERGFIRAEVFSFNDLYLCGNEKSIRDAGKLRVEGKDYLMQDGDICHFRFNV